jgi:hypothetical protein
MCTTEWSINTGLEATRGWAFCHPFEVSWPGFGKETSDEMKDIINLFYVDVRFELYKQLKCFGIAPIKFKRKKVNGHRIPFIPAVGSGFITTYLDEKDDYQQKYRWYWTNQRDREPDKSVFFIVWYPPTVDGHYTSPAVGALRAWKMAKASAEAADRVAYQNSRQPIFVKYSPPKLRPGDDRHVTVTFGEEEELEMQRDMFNAQLEQHYMSRNALNHALSQARGGNQQKQDTYMPLLWSETERERRQREGETVMDRLVPLEAYWSVERIPTNPLVLDPLKYEQHLAQVGALVADFPISMAVDPHSSRSSDLEAFLKVATERMKDVMRRMKVAMEEIIARAEQDIIAAERAKLATKIARFRRKALTDQEKFDLVRRTQVEVVQPCTPLLNFEKIMAVHDAGFLSAENAAKHVFHIFNLPMEDMEITKMMRPNEVQEAKLKIDRMKVKAQQQKRQAPQREDREDAPPRQRRRRK